MRRVVTEVLLLLGAAPGLAQKGDPTLVFVGSYTGEKSRGIYLFRLQPEGDEVFQNVTLVPLGLAAAMQNPAYLELDLRHRRLFAASDVEQGAIAVFAIDAAGKLAPINQRPTGGSRPCRLALDKDARHVLVANCGSGSVTVLPIGDNGELGEASDAVQLAGKSEPCVALDPESRMAVVCDHAADRLLIYRFDAATGKLAPSQPASVSLKAGSGPRQVLFRHDGRFAYVVNEKSSTISVLAADAVSATLTEVQSVSTLPEYFEGQNVAGELGMHRSGRWLYVSNIGHNSVVLFTIDQDKGTLAYVEEQGTGGRTPRFFGIEPSSRHLAISNKDSDPVLASRIDEGNGRLKPSGIFANVGSPASIRFLPPVGEGTSK